MKGYARTRLGQVHYMSAGEGPPLLLLPGAGQSHRIFCNLLPALAADYRAIAVDTPGSSMSARLPPGAGYGALAEVLCDVLDALEIARAHIYGIHTGNKIGAALAANWPDRTGDFIFCGQSHSIIADQERRNAHIREITAKHLPASDTDPALRRMKSWADAHTLITQIWWRADVFSADRPSAEAARKEIIAEVIDKLQSFDSIAALYEANFDYDMQSDLCRLPHRTLIVEIATPEEDRTIGRQGPELLKIIPCSDLVTFVEPDGLGLTLDSRADELAACIRQFLGNTPL